MGLGFSGDRVFNHNEPKRPQVLGIQPWGLGSSSFGTKCIIYCRISKMVLRLRLRTLKYVRLFVHSLGYSNLPFFSFEVTNYIDEIV